MFLTICAYMFKFAAALTDPIICEALIAAGPQKADLTSVVASPTVKLGYNPAPLQDRIIVRAALNEPFIHLML